MKNDPSINLLEEQIEKIDSLIKPPAFNPEYKMWDQTTRRILESMFDSETVKLFTSIHASHTAHTDEAFFKLYEEVLENKKRMLKEILSEHKRLANTQLSLAGEDKSVTEQATRSTGKKVFIGHGGASAWKDLRDFIRDRLRLPWDEFNRVPVAGITNIARLSEMLDAAAVAFLVMTGEDEQADGKVQARMNVVHEAGLFQGRLGFTRAIVLIEDGCEEFSNIEGLGQIPFPKSNIREAFEEIRRVLEREGILEVDKRT